MNKVIDIFHAPIKVFTSLKEKPEWVTPFVIILIITALGAAFVISTTRGNEELKIQQEEAMRERGLSDEQIEQAMQFTEGPLPIILGAISAPIFTAIVLVLFAVVLNLFIPLFGGKSGFKFIFPVVCFSSLVEVPQMILKSIIVAVSKSPFVTTSLALFVPTLSKSSFTYQLLNGFDFFILWEMILVAVGINITNEIKKKNAYILVFIIWVVSIFLQIGLNSLGGRRG
ncbi:MAG TPA: hypothetical protein ENI34_07100 [candidate division WOR-3 bacterium]|uniref:Yip1 domain-containing protein n=1 Tax=candidate division WOR-3 bacterium TaxID=2052148 RepID=A0A9C9K0P5_UNCW3|nr:hypothetical protein [candidate division WOR-3 bacterium]